MRIKTTNEYLVLLFRIALVMGLYSLCRLVFYYFNNDLLTISSFSGFLNILRGGLRFDLSAVLYINSLYIVLFLLPFRFKFRKGYRRVLTWLFMVTNAIGLAANISDIIYYRFTLKRTTAGVFETFSHEENLLALWGRFLIDYWYALLFWLVLLGILLAGYRMVRSNPRKTLTGWKYNIVGTLVFALVIGLSIGGMRGGFRHSTRPITISNAARYVNRPEQVAIVLNTPFSILRTFDKQTFEPVHYFDDEKLSRIYSPIHEDGGKTASHGTSFNSRRPNVVLIILESWGREHIGALNPELENGNYEGYTPFLDSLIHQSLAFDHAYANGRKSIDALPSIVASVPSLVQPYIISEYANNQINGMAGLLGKIGYETAFYHGAPNGSMGFLAFSNMAGFDQYKGMTEYDNDEDFDGMWGIWDEPFFQYFAKDMSSLDEPFFTTLFSLSSHHPFAVPEEYEGQFPEGPLPLHRSMGYTDMALKRFFETASQTDWFQNTLFVITADHCTVPHFEKYKTSVEGFAVPIIFYKPGDIQPRIDSGWAQQIDILPTVLSYLDYPYPFLAFGNDLFSTRQEDRFVINYTNENYQFIYKDYVILFDGEKVSAIYNLKEDPLQTNNLKGKIEVKEAKRLMKGIIQQYIDRMIHDELVVR